MEEVQSRQQQPHYRGQYILLCTSTSIGMPLGPFRFRIEILNTFSAAGVQLLEVLADDSKFRSMAMELLAAMCMDSCSDWSALLQRALVVTESQSSSPLCGLQVLEVLADDSNFRIMAMELSAAPVAAMLTLPPEAFESAWCAGDAPCTSSGCQVHISRGDPHCMLSPANELPREQAC